MTPYEPLHEYIQALADMNPTCKLLMRDGKFYTPQVLPRAYKRGVVRECYRNAFHLAVAHKELMYVEGLAMPDFIDIPIEHAWCVTEDGLVIDNTWPTIGAGYCGVEFDLTFVCRVINEVDHFGVIAWHSTLFREKYADLCRKVALYGLQV